MLRNIRQLLDPEESTSSALFRLTVVVVLCASSGATCNQQFFTPFGQAGPVAPQVLSPGAQVAQIAAVINANSARVQSFSAPAATITVPNTTLLPPLQGNIALERPQRFRLTAGTGITGQEIDLGSNEELFWLWIKRGQPPGVYLCRHHQFAGSAAHRIMPIEPRWLHSALGLTELDPASVYEGPLPHGETSIELRTYLPSANGTLHRVLVVDSLRGWVLEQHVYDPSGSTLLASAVAQSHRYYPLEQVSLPDRVAIQLPTAQMAFTINLGQVQLNQTAASPNIWTMPPFEGFQQFDLGTMSANTSTPIGGTANTSQAGIPMGIANNAADALGQTAASQMDPLSNLSQPATQVASENAWQTVPTEALQSTSSPSVYSAGLR